MMAEAAARGMVALQHCEACGAAQYPPREACRACLSDALGWTEAPSRPARLLAECTVAHSVIDGPVAPRRIALMALPGGVTALCMLASDAPDCVRAALDPQGRAILIAS